MNLQQASRNATRFVVNPAADLRSTLGIQGSRAAIADQPEQSSVEVSTLRANVLSRSVPEQTGFEERIFDSLVSLKVAVSRYAMHLPADERRRLFARLDEVINTEDWHEEDKLPILDSFVNFLKWIIFSKNFSWSSIGVSDDGNILAAWTNPSVSMTANFFPESKVNWTASVHSESGTARSVGTGALQHFAKQAAFYLSGGAAA